MFCSNCGKSIEEGKTYCKHCGALVPRPSGANADENTIRPRAPRSGSTGDTVPEPAIAPAPCQAPPPAAVPVPDTPPPVRPWSSSPPPPPSVASLLGQPTPTPEAPPPPPAPPVAAVPEWRPPAGPGDRGRRTGLIVAIAAAVVIVLAGAGVGVYFGLFRGGGDTDGSSTTLAVSSTTTESATLSTGGPATSGAVTTQTIPALTTSSTVSPSTSAGGPSTTQDLLAAYLAAAENLAVALDRDDRRIPELATEINNTAPAVPRRVRDELSAMLGGLDALNVELASLDVPSGFEDSYYWLEEAAMHMANRIDATIQGIEAIWAAGEVNAAAAGFFDTGRAERDAYRAAIKKYYELLPTD